MSHRLPLRALAVQAPMVLALLAALAGAPTARAQAPAPDAAALAGFTPDVVRSQVASLMPGLWHIDSFVPQAVLNNGTAVEPDIRTRFEVHASLAADTYVQDGNDGPMVFVRKVAPAGLQKVLYGLSTSTLQAGHWTTKLDMQNPTVLGGVGEPLATIPGRVIMRGSADEAAYLKQRDAEAQAAQQQALADAKRAEELAAQQRASATASAEAKRLADQSAAVATAQQQAAVAAVGDAARRQQAQLDEEEAAKLAQTKAADQGAVLQQQKDLAASQEAALAVRTKVLEELRTALQSQARSDRLAAIDIALASSDLTIRSLGYDAALGGTDPAAQNVALRRFFDAKRLIVFNVFAPSAFKQGEQPPGVVLAAIGGARLLIREFDASSGRFTGDLLFGSSLQWDAAGSIDRNTMSIVARGPGKPMPLYGAPVSLIVTLQLSQQKELDGFVQVGGSTAGVQSYSPLIIRVNLD